MEPHEIKSKVEEGQIHFSAIIEVAGKPKEHVEKAIHMLVDKIKQNDQLKIFKEEFAEIKQKEDDLFTTFVELEALAKNESELVWFCFDNLPSSVEIIDPQNINYKSKNFTDFLNDLQARLHKIDMVAKVATRANEVLQKNASAMLRNLIYLSLKDKDKDITSISKQIGVPETELQLFVDFLVQQNALIKKENLLSLNKEKIN